MTESQEAALKEQLKKSRIFWIPDADSAREISHVGPAPKAKPPDVDEPSEVAYLRGRPGQYLALYNCDPREIFVVANLF